MRLNLMRSLRRLADEKLLDEHAAQHVDVVESVVALARRSAVDVLNSYRADQLLSPSQQNLLGELVDDMNVVDPPLQNASGSPVATERSAAMRRLRLNSLTLLQELCETPLVFAVRQGDIQAVHDLLERGSDPNESDTDGVSPLCHACEIQSLAIIKLLVQFGADVNHETRVGHRPLDIARWHCSGSGASSIVNRIVTFLLEHGAEDHDPS